MWRALDIGLHQPQSASELHRKGEPSREALNSAELNSTVFFFTIIIIFFFFIAFLFLIFLLFLLLCFYLALILLSFLFTPLFPSCFLFLFFLLFIFLCPCLLFFSFYSLLILVLFLFSSHNHFDFLWSSLIPFLFFTFLYYSISLSTFVIFCSFVMDFAVVGRWSFALFCFVLSVPVQQCITHSGVEPLSQQPGGEVPPTNGQQQSGPRYNRRAYITHTKDISRASSSGNHGHYTTGSQRTPTI